ncbi:MAG TPA: DedA family protein [Candidatus Saccharimonadales bacterium]|nr:DedA family protein [Candidatus Saccharimonadales bacterium]
MHHTAQHIPSFIQALAPVIDRYGYLAVIGLIFLEDFGVPVPGETVLIASAFYAGIGRLDIFLVAILGFIGAVIGDNVGFAIGKYGGHPLVEKFGKYIFLTPSRIQKVEDYFRKHGAKIVVIARFVDGLRQANGIIAGLSEMSWLKFVSFNALGAALWVGTWSAIGYFGGDHIQTFLHYQLYFTAAVVVAVLVYLAVRLMRKRRTAGTAKPSSH